jgi:hypothetical protein
MLGRLERRRKEADIHDIFTLKGLERVLDGGSVVNPTICLVCTIALFDINHCT